MNNNFEGLDEFVSNVEEVHDAINDLIEGRVDHERLEIIQKKLNKTKIDSSSKCQGEPEPQTLTAPSYKQGAGM